MKPWLMLLFLLPAACSFAQTRDAEFNKLADRYFDEAFFRFDPVQGTQAGFHQYDAQLPSMSAAEEREEIEALRRFGRVSELRCARTLARRRGGP